MCQTDETGKNVYVFTTHYRENRVVKVIVHINYCRKKRVFNYAKSWGIVDEDKMDSYLFDKIK